MRSSETYGTNCCRRGLAGHNRSRHWRSSRCPGYQGQHKRFQQRQQYHRNLRRRRQQHSGCRSHHFFDSNVVGVNSFKKSDIDVGIHQHVVGIPKPDEQHLAVELPGNQQHPVHGSGRQLPRVLPHGFQDIIWQRRPVAGGEHQRLYRLMCDIQLRQPEHRQSVSRLDVRREPNEVSRVDPVAGMRTLTTCQIRWGKLFPEDGATDQGPVHDRRFPGRCALAGIETVTGRTRTVLYMNQSCMKGAAPHQEGLLGAAARNLRAPRRPACR